VARRLTVLQLLPALRSGGVEQGVLELGAELARRGHRSLVVSGGGRMVSELERGGSEHIRWSIARKSPLVFLLVPRLRRLLREREVDILHARSRLPAWVAYLAWRSMPAGHRPRFLTTVHGLYSVSRYSSVMTRGERVIAVSDCVRDYLIQNYPGMEASHIRVIPRGVDHRQFPYGYAPSAAWIGRWQAEFPQLRQRRLLTLPGRLTRLKGHADFIRLLASLKARGVEVHGLIVGALDPRRQHYVVELRELASAQGVDQLTFTGQRSDMREIYAVSELVLSLSRKAESFGRTVLEALTLGVPVAGYAHGGVGEILARIYPQGAIPVGDDAALLERVAALLEQSQRPPPQQAYTLDAMLVRTVGLYEELCP